jgi:hypothetical protein
VNHTAVAQAGEDELREVGEYGITAASLCLAGTDLELSNDAHNQAEASNYQGGFFKKD